MPFKNELKGARLSSVLFLIPFLGGLIIAFLSAIFLPQPITGKFYEFLLGSLILFLWGMSGLVVFIRRELFQLGIRIQGKLAMVYGVFIMVTCWFLSFLFLYKAIRNIL
jgi:hypothetical protein